jgi:hypothetical protein
MVELKNKRSSIRKDLEERGARPTMVLFSLKALASPVRIVQHVGVVMLYHLSCFIQTARRTTLRRKSFRNSSTETLL